MLLLLSGLAIWWVHKSNSLNRRHQLRLVLWLHGRVRDRLRRGGLTIVGHRGTTLLEHRERGVAALGAGRALAGGLRAACVTGLIRVLGGLGLLLGRN